MLWWLICLYVVIICFVSYALLCADSNNGFMGKVNYFITEGIFNGVRRAIGCVCPKVVVNGVDKSVDYCCYKPNPFLQILFLSLVLGGYVFFIRDALPFLPGPFLSSIHRVMAHVAVSVTVAIFIIASIASPGKVTTNNLKKMVESFPYDDMIYERKVCKTCNVERPARSKHCSFCNICVSRFDHHCPWINNCVGEYNLRFFLSFLLSTAALCTYCAYLSFYILYGLLDSKGLMNVAFRDASGRVTPVPYTYLLQYVIVHGGTVFPLGLFCAIIAVVLYLFWGYHMYLVYQNTTTNETYKWQDYLRLTRLDLELKKEKEATEQNPQQDAKVVQRKKSKQNGQKKDEINFDLLTPPKYRLNDKGKIVLKNVSLLLHNGDELT